VSIGLPVFNGSRYVREAIESILAQTYTAFELIISDNASTDDTPEILQAYAEADSRIRLYRNDQNMGAAWNYNRVFALARGEYFKWAAHDDVIAPIFLEQCLSILEGDAAIVLCYSKTGRLNELGELSGEYIHPLRIDSPRPWVRFRDLVLIDHNCVGVFGLIRRQALAQTPLIGTYVGSDRVLLAELGLRGRFCEIPQQLFFRRNHPQTSVRTYNEYERASWFDPRKANRLTFPNWRKGWEYLRCIARAWPGWKDSLFSAAVVALWFKNYRKRLAMDLRMAAQRSKARRRPPGRLRPGRDRPAKT
jgi:glycosyltransferase involved in cell wall biosynthesis